MTISVKDQRKLLERAKRNRKHLTLPERWKEEDELNKKLGVYNTNSMKIPKARKVSKEELDKLLEKSK
ncbi:hypothetical protein [Staphylococcus saprophyticus]|uniref:hypothetical protein n=1 Tax=Staphylococcus saprophyticus TaxID=29385 RepID=UPI0030BC6A6D